MNTLGQRGFCVNVLDKGKSLGDFIQSKISASPYQDDPFYVVDVGCIVRLYKKWTSLCPNIKPFYAVKCNNDPVLLKILSELGAGFDCANKTEIETILSLCVEPDRIVYANPCKHISHLGYAAEKNVAVMTFDNDLELTKTATHYPTAKLVVRICADDPTAIKPMGAKFGCSVSKACHLLNKAKKMNLNVIGVSFHVGTGSQSPDAFRIALEKAYKVFQFADSIGYQFSLLDIGGGFPGPRQEQDSLLAAITSTINVTIDRLFTAKYPSLDIISEPGRFFACIPFTIAVLITSKRVCKLSSPEFEDNSNGVENLEDKEPEEKEFMYYLNDGMYGSFRAIQSFNIPITLKPLQLTPAPLHSCTLWGPAMASSDKICDTLLPELSVGDWLYMEEMGAYTSVLHSKFSGFNEYRVYYYLREEDRAVYQEHGLMQSESKKPVTIEH